MTRRIEAQIERLHPVSGILFWPRVSLERPTSNGGTPTSSAATSTAGTWIQATLHQAHAQGQPLFDTCRRTLHLLLIDATVGVHEMCGYLAARVALRYLQQRGGK